LNVGSTITMSHIQKERLKDSRGTRERLVAPHESLGVCGKAGTVTTERCCESRRSI